MTTDVFAALARDFGLPLRGKAAPMAVNAASHNSFGPSVSPFYYHDFDVYARFPPTAKPLSSFSYDGKEPLQKKNKSKPDVSSFDDLIPSFGQSMSRTLVSEKDEPRQSPVYSTKPPAVQSTDPFVVFESASTSVCNSPLSKCEETYGCADIICDLSSIFGAATPSKIFQDIEGQSGERQKVTHEKNRQVQQRAAKALAELNEREVQAQWEREERHKIAETMDAIIRIWSSGKEGNVRALLSSLQNILWPECGWQPVSLPDLLLEDSVKKVYKKAALCIHPDKMRQKGATLQQMYIAEKVFDLVKDAWSKFIS